MRTPTEAEQFIQTLESLADDASASAKGALNESEDGSAHPDDRTAARTDCEQLTLVAREIQILAHSLYGRIVMGRAA